MNKEALSQMVHVSRSEWPRVLHAWGLRFLYQMGYVMGWTLITAMVVTHFGIQGLPFFYILNGVLIILGTYGFSHLISWCSHRTLILFTAGSAALLLSLSLIFFDEQKVWFVMALILAISIFSSQLHILLLSYIEELFSPLENERLNPLIETAEPLGGVAAGLAFVSLVTVLRPEGFVYLWVLALCGIIPVYYALGRSRRKYLPRLHVEQSHTESSLGKGMEYVKGVSFVKWLFVVILFQWMFVNLMEYQYTSALNASVSHALHEAVTGETPLAHATELTHGLGTFHLLFSLGMLCMQLFVSSRLVRGLGIVRSMMLMPIGNLINSVLLFFQFGLGTAVLTKGMYEALLVVYNNGYHNSYYAFYEGVREQVREVLEGGIRSLGVILGTGLLIVVQVFAPDTLVSRVIAVLMGVVSVVMLILLWKMRRQYTVVSSSHLEVPGAHPEKFNAIEILTQRGHLDAGEILTSRLLSADEPVSVKVKILEALGQMGDLETLPEILAVLDDPEEEIQIAALEAIASFKDLGDQFYTQAFAKQRVIDTLSGLFDGRHSLPVQSAVVHAFASIRHPEVVGMLLKGLDSDNEQLRANCIFIIGMFGDPSTGFYLEKMLNDPYPKARANAIIALWQFKKYRPKVMEPLEKMLKSRRIETLLAGVYVLGEIGLRKQVSRLQELLEHSNERVRQYASIALFKMEHPDALEPLTAFLLHPDKDTARHTRELLAHLPHRIGNSLRAMLLQEVHHILRERYGETKTLLLQELSEAELEELAYYYELLDEDSELAKIHFARAER